MFYVGQKVVCVDDVPRKFGGLDDLRAGNIYTIRWIGIHKNAVCVRVCEIPARARRPFDLPYFADRFRPVVEKKTDISIFTGILRRETIEDGPVVAKPRKVTVFE